MSDLSSFLAAALGVVLLTAGILKVRDPAASTSIIRRFILLAAPMEKGIVAVVSLSEAFVGVLLVAGMAPIVAARLALGLFLLVTLPLVILYVRGERQIACNCFGRDSEATSIALLLARNAAFVAAALTLVSSSQPGFTPVGERVLATVAAFAGLGVVMIAKRITVTRRWLREARGPEVQA